MSGGSSLGSSTRTTPAISQDEIGAERQGRRFESRVRSRRKRTRPTTASAVCTVSRTRRKFADVRPPCARRRRSLRPTGSIGLGGARLRLVRPRLPQCAGAAQLCTRFSPRASRNRGSSVPHPCGPTGRPCRPRCWGCPCCRRRRDVAPGNGDRLGRAVAEIDDARFPRRRHAPETPFSRTTPPCGRLSTTVSAVPRDMRPAT